MNDYIDRQAAIDALDRFSLGETDVVRLAFRMGDYLKRLPSAQPERKKGKWRDYPIADGCWQCSSCGVLRMGEPSNYCPNCGARMDLKEEAETEHEQN